MLTSPVAFWWKMAYEGSDCVKQNWPRQRAEPRRHIIDKVTCAAAEGCKLPNPCSHSIASVSTACFWHGSKKFGDTGLLYWGSLTHSKNWAVCICPASQDIACLSYRLLTSWGYYSLKGGILPRETWGICGVPGLTSPTQASNKNRVWTALIFGEKHSEPNVDFAI